MMPAIIGAVLVVGSGVGFWSILPRNGKVHPLVEKFDGGSLITLAIMTIFTVGVVLLWSIFLG